MAVPADSTPYYVDGANGRNSDIGTENAYFGPFAKPGAASTSYGVVENSWSGGAPSPLPPPPSMSFSFYKSTNAGHNWTRVASKTYNENLDVFYPGTGTIIYCAFCDTALPLPANPTDTVKLVTFDMASDSFGTVITGGPTSWVGVAIGNVIFKLFRLSNGDQILIYPKPVTPGGSDTKLYWAQCTAGVWTSVDNLLTDTGVSSIPYTLDNCFVDSNDRIHIFGVAHRGSGIFDTFYTNLKAGVQSAVQIFYTPPGAGSAYVSRIGPGVYYPSDDSIEVPLAESVLAADAYTRISLLRGAPSAAPVFDPL